MIESKWSHRFAILLLLLCTTDTPGQTKLQAHTAVDTLGFTVGPRLFQKSEVDSLIRTDAHVDSIVLYPGIVRITEGASFDLKDMYVLAIDSQGDLVQKAPLELELDAFNCTIGTERIMGFRVGTARLRITSLLPRKDGKTRTGVDIGIEVTPWPNY